VLLEMKARDLKIDLNLASGDGELKSWGTAARDKQTLLALYDFPLEHLDTAAHNQHRHPVQVAIHSI
jgi:hypothetical protein